MLIPLTLQFPFHSWEWTAAGRIGMLYPGGYFWLPNGNVKYRERPPSITRRISLLRSDYTRLSLMQSYWFGSSLLSEANSP